jgi:hypothetical protein
MYLHGAIQIARHSPKKVVVLPWATPGRHWNSVGNQRTDGSTSANLSSRLNSPEGISLQREKLRFWPVFGFMSLNLAGDNE